MGTLKPLADLGGRTLLAWAVGGFAAIAVEDIVVVTGHRGDEVAAAAEALGARPVANPRWADGMYTSVQAGAAAVGDGRRFFVLPVDCPLVRPESVGRLARVGEAAGAAVVMPETGGLAGHPPLLAPELRRLILAEEPDDGLRGLLSGYSSRTLRVDVADPRALLDADTAGELEELRRLARTEALPSEARCREILIEAGVPSRRAAHCEAVAEVAAALAAGLNERGQCLCVPLVVAGALLHDVARSEGRHDVAGAELLRRLGYPRVAPLVGRHMRLGDVRDEPPDEAQVVFLADKLVAGDQLVGVEARFAARFDRWAGNEAALAEVRARLQEARVVQARIEAVIGRGLSL